MNTTCRSEPSTIDTDVAIEELVAEAARHIGPVWPLKTGVACNPLLGLEHEGFWAAVEEVGQAFPRYEHDAEVNGHFLKWIQAFLDEGQAVWAMPGRQLGFYRCWLTLVRYDRTLVRTKEDRRVLTAFPDAPAKFIATEVRRSEIQDSEIVPYFARELRQISGWAGYVKRQLEWGPLQYPIDLVQFLAVRIGIGRFVSQIRHRNKARVTSQGRQAACHTKRSYRWTQEQVIAHEDTYRAQLVAQLSLAARERNFCFRKSAPLGQCVFCIDVRSERFRKQLEAQGHWETFGCAGFFGLPVSLHTHNTPEPYSSCPVLLNPRHTLSVVPRHSVLARGMQRIRTVLHNVYQELKYSFGTPFALAETIGPWSGIWMMLRSWLPHVTARLRKLDQDQQQYLSDVGTSISIPEQIEYAQSALSLIGLKEGFAPIIVFCGHRSTTQNNPHAATLHCGACGGNEGGFNAQALAQILNAPQVRTALKNQGILIPEQTLFLGAEHDTTTDAVTLFEDRSAMAPHHRHILQKLRADLRQAQIGNATTRMASFAKQGVGAAIRKSIDWSDTRPEWGLARNAAFLIAPRTLSERLDLEGRCFLHSYDYIEDQDGSALETILTRPMVVAEWINAQYFFSSLDPIMFGSGSKVTHNIVGKVGVIQGNGSDLMHGLPLQSTHADDSEPYHIPMRLLTIIFAPRTRIDPIIAKHLHLQHLFFRHWVHLVTIDPIDGRAYRLEGAHTWTELLDNM